MEIRIKPHTVIFTVAPSGSGKSTFCNDVLVKQLKSKYPEFNVQYISSDDIRLMVLGQDSMDFEDNRLMEASETSFRLLELRLESSMKYDVRAEIIIVDTTGLSPIFREYINKVCNENRYSQMPIIFDYKDYKDYYTHNESNKVTSIQLRKFRHDVISKISKSKYPSRVRIQSREKAESYDVIVENYNAYISHILPKENNYVIVSDIHGCLDTFKELILLQPDTTIEDDLIVSDKIFIVQDFIDKGTQVLETIEFLHKNYINGRILVLRGNHENFVYKALKGLNPEFEEKFLKGELREILDNHFSTYFDLVNDENIEVREKFFHLFETGRDFYIHPNFFVNHSPCHPKYLGKLDGKSISAMRGYSYIKRETDETDESYSDRLKAEMHGFLDLYNNRNYRPIIWGHVSLGRVYSNNKNYMIDTGCVSGGSLTSVDFNYKGIPFFKAVNSNIVCNKFLPVFINTSKEINFKDLEGKEVNRIRFMAKDKVNFIMGTMSPSDKDSTDELNTLESLKAGLDYFKDKGVSKVMMQKKYMGSNAQVYLHRDVSKSYATSRNGYFIKNDLSKPFADLHEKMLPFMIENDYEMILMSAELMPFMELGKGLIDYTFKNAYVGFSTEASVLAETGFYDKLIELFNHPRRDEFRQESKSLSNKALNDKYGSKDYSILKNLDSIESAVATLDEETHGVKTYEKQLDLFTKDGEPYFLPFSLLKGIKTDGTEDLFLDAKNEDLFKIVSNDDYHMVDFSDPNHLVKAQEYYNTTCMVDGMEGVVLKPEIVDTEGVLPFLKVRNPNYLVLTYGYDYLKSSKFNKLFNRKYIKSKLSASMKQWRISKAMLAIPHSEISMSNNEYVNLAIKMVIEEKRAESIDPRL